MKYSDTVVLVFAKAPVSGKVNTRLIPAIGEEKATRLQYDLIHQRVSLLVQSQLCSVILYCVPDDTHSCFKECAIQYSVALKVQHGIDLGARMANAIEEQKTEFENIFVVGTDAPDLDVTRIEQAILSLQNDFDVVIVPAEDGGYVLIGMNASYKTLFTTVPWGSERVLTKTRGNIVAAGLRLVELESCWDIDSPEDYYRYKQGTDG